MKLKSVIMDESAVRRSMARITHEIIEKNRGCEDIVLVGIRRRGVPIAQILHDNLLQVEGVDVPLCALDITAFRDDCNGADTAAAEVLLPDTDIAGKAVVLADDVICTGRTVRAAIDALFSRGRASSVQLAVLIDRGHRELPIRPDYVGKNVPTAKHERIDVHMAETDGDTGVYLMQSV